jgi:SSS family solute:Na+ symporter
MSNTGDHLQALSSVCSGVLALAELKPLDWVIVAAYMLVLLLSGVWLARREPAGHEEYFVASRRMPVWAVALSIIASSLSVATFIGVPEQAFKGNLTYLSTNIGTVLGVFVVAWFFIPAFYRYNCLSIYELLERRMGPTARRSASAAFMIGRVFASGARVFIGAIPLAAVLFGLDQMSEPGPLAGAIVIVCFVAVVYTLVGGISSVIWTDVIQTVVMLAAVVAAIVFLWYRIPAAPDQVLSALQTGGPNATSKLTIIDLGIPFDPSAAFTLITAVFAFTLLSIASNGTDHDMVQRMISCRSAVQGGRSALVATFLAIPVVSLFMVVGLLLYVFYQRPDLMGSAAPGYTLGDKQQPFLVFIVRELPTGLGGLMVAGLFAVGLGSLNSAINAMAATFIKDFYMTWRPGRTDRHYMVAGRWAVVGWGVVLGVFAILCIFWKRANPDTKLIDFALGVMTFAYSGLLAVFLSALFTKRGSGASVVGALVTGFLTIAYLQFLNRPLWSALNDRFGWYPKVDGVAPDIAQLMPWTNLAFPWQLVIATALAFVVCQLGRPNADATEISTKRDA